MRKAGVSYAFIPLAILIIGIAFLADHSTTYAVLTFSPTYATENCDDLLDNNNITDSSCVGSPGENVTAGAATANTIHTAWLTPDSIFSFYATSTPPDSFVAPGTDHALGANMGVIENTPKLGLGNSACNVTPAVDFTFFNATTDVTNTTSSLPEGFSDRHGILMMVDTVDNDGDGVYSDDGAVGDESPGTIAPGYYTAGDDDGDTLVNEDPPELLETDSGANTAEALAANETDVTVDVAAVDSTADLAAALDDFQTDVDVTDGTVFSVGDGILVDSEIMEITLIDLIATPDELTVVRGAAGTAAATHLTGTDIFVGGATALTAGDRILVETEIMVISKILVDTLIVIRTVPALTHSAGADVIILGSPVAGDGLANHVRYYPRWLNDTFDPDLDGLKLDPAANGFLPPLVPHARYSGMSLVLGVPVILGFVQFAPGGLTGFPAGNNFNELTTDLGWINQIILQDVSEVVSAPSAITSFCETQSHTRLFGVVAAVDRYKNPPAGTGLVDPVTGFGTNTHLSISYTQSGRDLDGDGIPNVDTYDTCATVANPGWDPTTNRPVPGQATDSDSDGIPEVDTNANTVIDAADGCDNAIVFPPVFDHESTPEGNCADNIDDDKDGRVNDNCPVVGADPEINQCDNNTDDDGDGFVNDGCAVVLVISEASIAGACANDFDDDFDFRVNDGCPANAAAEVQQCNEPEGFAVNDDSGDDGVINDGCFRNLLLAQEAGDLFLNGDDNCPILYNPLQTEGEDSQTWAFATGGGGGPRGDAMGDECDPNPNVADGDYLAIAVIDAICITPGTDGDGDGYCDATETALGSLPGVAGSTPEHHMVHPPFPLARGGATGGVPTACSDGVDNDGDGDIDGVDTGCQSPNDGDEDGLTDVGGTYTDNCPGNDALLVTDPVNVGAYNPTQTDTDGDTIGDACDDDIDGDGRTQTHERFTGHDVMDDCPNNVNHDAWTFDTNNSGNVNLVDLVGAPSFKNAFGTSQGDPTYFRQFDFNASGNVNLVDLVGTPGSFKNSFGTAC